MRGKEIEINWESGIERKEIEINWESGIERREMEREREDIE